ncbi:MAG: ATP-binding protein [Planctomycetota bacterium]|nr:ATP-binding protein [Planctomycetota bacterium]
MTGLRSKLWLGFGGLLLVLLSVSALSAIVLTRFSHTLEQAFSENYNSAVFCNNMKEALDGLNIRAQNLIWEKAMPGVNADDQRQRFDENLNRQLNNCTLPREKELSNRLADLWRKYQTAYARFEASGSNRVDFYVGGLLPQYNALRNVTQQIGDMNMSNMVSVDGRVKTTLLEVRRALLFSVVAGTMLAGLVVWATGSAVLRQLAALTRSARQIEAGDLDLQLFVSSRDEIGQLSAAFNSMTARLREFRREDHERLERSRQTTQLAIDSLPEAVFVVGPEGSVEIANRSALSHFGIVPGSNVVNLKIKWLTNLYEVVRADKTPVEPQGYQSAIQLFENGEERFLLPRAMPMLREDNALIGVTVILGDVTGLRRADEAKSNLVSTVSHELRTPMTSIRMALGLLAGGKLGQLNAKQEKLVTAAREDSDRLNRILENLMNMSRIEAGRAQFQFVAMAPRDILAQSVESLRPAFAEKGLQLEIETGPDLPEVSADNVAITSALSNLLSNAIKFTGAGGVVRVSCQRNGHGVEFTVADTGPGIEPQYRSRIFEKFFRIPSPSGPGGAGLGLAIAKEIIEAHGGKIECLDSGDSVGSVFRFILPLRNGSSSAA